MNNILKTVYAIVAAAIAVTSPLLSEEERIPVQDLKTENNFGKPSSDQIFAHQRLFVGSVVGTISTSPFPFSETTFTE